MPGLFIATVFFFIIAMGVAVMAVHKIDNLDT